MVNCERCGISEEDTPDGLYAVVYKEKLVPMCRRCADFEDLIIIKRVNAVLEPVKERHQSVYERMVHISGVKRDPKEFDKKRPLEVVPAGPKEPTLRDIVEKNLKKAGSPVIDQKVMTAPKVVNNHHWIVMRARRSKKISQDQLAELINEPVIVIVDIERGKIPDNPFVLRKVEDALKIKILAEPAKPGEYFSPVVNEVELAKIGKRERPLAFDSNVFEEMKVEDLKDLDAETQLETGQDKASYWSKFKKKSKKKEIKEEPVEAEEYIEEVTSPESVEEASEEVEEVAEEAGIKKPGFFKRLFSRKKKVEEPEPEEALEEVVVEEPTEKKPEPRKSYRERQQQTVGMSKRDLSSREINELIFGKKEAKEKKK